MRPLLGAGSTQRAKYELPNGHDLIIESVKVTTTSFVEKGWSTWLAMQQMQGWRQSPQSPSNRLIGRPKALVAEQRVDKV